MYSVRLSRYQNFELWYNTSTKTTKNNTRYLFRCHNRKKKKVLGTQPGIIFLLLKTCTQWFHPNYRYWLNTAPTVADGCFHQSTSQLELKPLRQNNSSNNKNPTMSKSIVWVSNFFGQGVPAFSCYKLSVLYQSTSTEYTLCLWKHACNPVCTVSN